MALLEIGDEEGQVFQAGSNGQLKLGGQKLNAAEFVNLATNGPVKFGHLDDVLDTLGSECFGTSKEKDLGVKLQEMRVTKSFRIAKDQACAVPASFHTEL